MKRNVIYVLLVIVALFSIACSPAFAAAEKADGLSVTLNLKELPDDLRNQVINAMDTGKNAAAAVTELTTMKTSIEQIKELTTTFAIGFKEVCTVLSVEVNEFIKTPVGNVVAIGVLYKAFNGKEIGTKLYQLVVGTPIWIFLVVVYCRAVRRGFIVTRRKESTLDDDGNAIKGSYKFIDVDPLIETTFHSNDGSGEFLLIILYIVVGGGIAVFTGFVFF